MAGGEKAKSSGEYGEQIVKIFLIWWDGVMQIVEWRYHVYIKKNIKRKNSKESQKHGIDYVYTYKSQLRDAIKQDVLVSVKCRDGYPVTDSGIKSKFKEFVLDLAYAMECYPACELAKKKIPNTDKEGYIGINILDWQKSWRWEKMKVL